MMLTQIAATASQCSRVISRSIPPWPESGRGPEPDVADRVGMETAAGPANPSRRASGKRLVRLRERRAGALFNERFAAWLESLG